MKPLLLNGRVNDPAIEEAERELQKLQRAADHMESMAFQVSTTVETAKENLRPLYNALRLMFGESQPQSSNGDPRLDNLSRWDGVKKRLGGNEAELIEVLLTAGPKTNKQLMPLLKRGYTTVSTLTQKLHNMGFIVKTGDSWKLKE